jgi:class 3 adenylate cyclase
VTTTEAARRISPESFTPKHLAQKILTSKAALEGERKQVTVLFADLKGSMELLADRDPEEARKILDPVLTLMMEAVHHYEGTVNQVMGDGIMALFGAPLAHEDHAVRACYAALRMQESVRQYAEGIRRDEGVSIQIRVGLNSGEVVVRSIGSDLRMDYTAVGQTTHLAARMEQLAAPGSIAMAPETLRLAEGYVAVKPLGPAKVKGLSEPVDVYEVASAGAVRTRLERSAARGFTRFVGRDADGRKIREKVTGKLLILDETLRPLSPALLALLDIPVEDRDWQALDPPQRRRHTHEGIKRLLLRESQRQPLCLVFEDLHWVDAESQAVLDGLVESLPAARLLLLLSYRPEYRHPWGSKTYYNQARIDPLPAANATELLGALLGAEPSILPLIPLLIERTEGNPFFLEESVRALVETGVLAGDPGRYRLARPLGSIQVPATVQAVLAARIDRLPPEAKSLLQSASVVGKDVPFAQLSAIAELPEEVLRAELALEPDRRRPPGGGPGHLR